jgi:hypothetical protein
LSSKDSKLVSIVTVQPEAIVLPFFNYTIKCATAKFRNVSINIGEVLTALVSGGEGEDYFVSSFSSN